MKSRNLRAAFLYRALLGLAVVLPLTSVVADELVSEPRVVPSMPLTITNLQRLGLEANGLIRAEQSKVDAAEAGVISAGAYPNPELEFVGGYNRSRAPGPIPGNSYGAFVSQQIENPFLRIARIGSAEADVEASQAGLDRVRADLAAALRVRAYELLLRQEIANVESGVLDLMKEIRRRVKISVETGETARFELIKAEAEVLTAESRKETALLDAQRARVALIKLTAGALKTDFEISASLLDQEQLPPLEVLRDEVQSVNPDVSRLQAELNSAHLKVDQERAAIIPSLQLKVGQQRDPEFYYNIASLNLQIPLFDRRRGPIAAAVSESEQVRETLEYRRFEISQLLESSWQRMQIAERKVEMFETGIINQAESALRVAQTAYRFGERGLLDVLDAQRVLRSVRADLLQARFEFQSAVAEIHQLRGYYPKEHALK
ncbi:MAG: TolC family protein [Nitrosomonadales bacterium]|nr:MAG: TolC family protein [Nitrosomonadales bacterium]